jgi:hypothetical protein
LARLAVGASGDWPYVAGVQAPEGSGGTPFRWSGGRAEIRLPAPSRGQSSSAEPATAVRLRLAVPPVGPPDPWPVTVRVEGAAPVVLMVGPAWADYTVPLAPAVSGDLHIYLDSAVRRPQDYAPTTADTRLLGVGVQTVERMP